MPILHVGLSAKLCILVPAYAAVGDEYLTYPAQSVSPQGDLSAVRSGSSQLGADEEEPHPPSDETQAWFISK